MKLIMIRHKFHAKPTTVGDHKFGSKKEAKRYQELLLLKSSGEVLFFLMQTRFDLPGGVIYRCDFMVFWRDGEVTIEDVKGMCHETYIVKKKILEATYPIMITEI